MTTPSLTLPAMMPAIWYELTGPARSVLIVGERPRPDPGPGEVLVEIAASAVNPHDVKRRSGWTGAGHDGAPVVPHSDGSGTIVAVGSGVDAARIGREVWLFHCGGGDHRGQGALAGYVALPQRQAVDLPEGLDLVAAATLGVPAMTAHYAVFCDGPVAGQSVLVAGGAGAVAGFAIRFAKEAGARVAATVSSPEKAAIARSHGADLVLDYRREPVVARIQDWTGGSGVNRIIEVDFGENVEADACMIANGGAIASYSSTRVREPQLPYYRFQAKGVRLHFVQAMLLSQSAEDAAIADINRGFAQRWLAAPQITRFAFAQAAAAHEWQESGTGIGKAVVMMP